MGDTAPWAVSLAAASQAIPRTAHVECAAFGMGAQILKLAHKSSTVFSV